MRGRYGVIQMAVPLVLSSGIAAQAQAPKADPQACATIVKANERLDCFDKAFPKRPAPASAKAQTGPTDLKLLVTKERQCDVKALYEAVTKAVGAKSEYETKEAFGERGLKQLAAAGVSTTGIFCKSRGLPPNYDAENGGYLVDGMPPYKQTSDSLGHYDGITSTGSKIKVEKIAFKSWTSDYQYSNKVIAQIPVAEAQKLGGKIAQGEILDIVSPFYRSYQLAKQPTISEPTQEDSVIASIELEPRYVFLYNTETFEVLWSRPVIKCGRSISFDFMIEKCDSYSKPWTKN